MDGDRLHTTRRTVGPRNPSFQHRLELHRIKKKMEQLSNVVFWLIESGGVFLLNDSVIEGPSFDDERYFFVAVEPSPFL